MTSLYTLRTHSLGFAINKLDGDLNPEASYLVTTTTCDCPAGQRPTCKHRKMLPYFLATKHIDDGWFLDWDTRQWRPALTIKAPTEPEVEKMAEAIAPAFESHTSNPTLAKATAPTMKRRKI